MKKILLCLSLLLLVSCHSGTNNEQEVIEFNKNYSFKIPFQISSRRHMHQRRGVYRDDSIMITKGLYDYMSYYFGGSDDYLLAEGQEINDKLFEGLMRFKSNDNPNGLNPEANASFVLDNGKTVTQPIIVTDLFELDVYDDKNELVGMSIGLCVKQSVSEDGKLSDADLKKYGENAGRQLVSILRKEEKMAKAKIVVAIYNLEKVDSSLPGNFIGSLYFDHNAADFDEDQSRWYLLPSSDASKNFSELSESFNVFKNNLSNLIIDDYIGVVGQLNQFDGSAKELYIDVTSDTKSYPEIQVLVNYISKLLKQHFSSDLHIKVRIMNGREVKAIMEKKGEVVNTILW